MFELDGMALLDEMFIASASKTDKKTAQIMRIFRKHGIDVLTGMAMLMEIAAVFEKGEEDEDNL